MRMAFTEGIEGSCPSMASVENVVSEAKNIALWFTELPKCHRVANWQLFLLIAHLPLWFPCPPESNSQGRQ